MSGVLHQAIARVLRSGAGNAQPDQPIVVGTGVLVSTPQLGPCLLTCAHVVNSAFGWRQGATQAPGKEQVLFFDLPAKGIVYKAELAVWTPPLRGRDRTDHPACDLALLKLLPGQSLPGDLRLHRPQDFKVLDDTVLVGQQLHSFGFSRDAGSHVSGMAQGTDASGWLHLEASTDTEEFVAPGFSGAPVFDAARRFILGLVVSLDEDGSRAFLQSVANIQRAIPELARPYRGLKAFEEEDAEFFFGREAFVGQMLAKMPKYPLIGVTGASGAGKSSAIRAGVIPRLRTDRSNIILIMRPGDDPWKALAKTLIAQTQKDGDILDRADRISDMAERLRTKFGALKDYAAALLDEAGAGRLVIFVDQFEELFSLAGHERAVPLTGKKLDDFRDLMVATATLDGQTQIQWLFSLRGDFVDRAFRPPDFVELMDDGNIILPDLKPEELRAAIKEPAAKLDVEFEKGTQNYPGLVERIARDAGETAGALPLMQHVLELLWRDMALRPTEDDAFVHELTHAAYDRLGGLPGALDRHAEEVYTGLEPAEQELMPRLFSRLVNVKEDGEATRRIARRSELRKAPELDKNSTSGEEMWRLAAKLAGEDFRLLVLRSGSEPDVTLPGHQASQEIETDDQTVEVAHEALLRNWVRLQGWIRNDRRFLLWRQRLELLIREHNDPQIGGPLLTGGPLETARGFLATKGDDLSKEEEYFIKKSQDEDDRLKTEKELQQIERGRQRNTRVLVWALLAVAVISILAAVGGGFLYQLQLDATRIAQEAIIVVEEATRVAREEKKRADEQTQRALSNETQALLALSKNELTEGRPVDALKFALAAWPKNASDPRPHLPKVPAQVAAPLISYSIPLQTLVHDGPVRGTHLLSDGRILSWSEAGTLRVWDAATGQPVGSPMMNVAGSLVMPSGRILYWTTDALWLWDSTTGQQVGSPMEHGHRALGALVMPDGRILSWYQDDTLRLWDAATSQQVGPPMHHDHSIAGALVMPDGLILSWSDDDTLRLWDAATGQQVRPPMTHDDDVLGALVMPDGRILSWSEDNTLRLWDAATGQQVGPPMTHVDDVLGALVMSDGRILSWSDDSTLRQWDATTGQQVGPPMEHDGGVIGALVMPDGHILSWSDDKTLRLWDADTHQQVGSSMTHDADGTSAILMADGRILSWSNDKSLRLWNATGEQVGLIMKHDESVSGAREMPDGRILSWSADHTLRLWNAVAGQQAGPTMKHEYRVVGALEMTDGRVLSWSYDNTLRLWDTATGRQTGPSMNHEESVLGALVIPDGRILSWSADKTLRLWDAATSQQVGSLMKHDATVAGALVVSNTHILSWSDDNTLRLWNAATGQQVGSPMKHGHRPLGALVMPDGRILSWSEDDTLRLWDAATSQQVGPPMKHDNSVAGALVMPDGRILSWSDDYTLRLWDAATSQQVGPPMKHDNSVAGALVMPDGRILSWSEDDTLRLWDAAIGHQVGLPMMHDENVQGALVMPDGRILSWSGDKTLRLWDTTNGQQVGPSMSPDDGSSAVGALIRPDGRILSWSTYGTLHLWDPVTGQQLGPPMDYDDVYGAIILHDSRILSWADDLRIWNVSWPEGNIFEIACALLNHNFDLSNLKIRFDLEIRDPICADPAGIPTPSMANSAGVQQQQQPAN